MTAKMIHATAINVITLGLIILTIGLGFYGTAIFRKLLRSSYSLAYQASKSASHGADSRGIIADVMEIYRGMSGEEREDGKSQSYLARFSGIDKSKGSAHDILIHMLRGYQEVNNVEKVFLGMYDEDTDALVYIVDPDDRDLSQTGKWESVDKEEVQKFLSWDKNDMLYTFVRTKYGFFCRTAYPILNDEKEITAFILVNLGLRNLLVGVWGYFSRIVIVLSALAAVITWLLTRYMTRAIVRPINTIADAAAAYAREKSNGEAFTDCFASLGISSNDELESLGRTMADMEQDLARYEHDIVTLAKEKERINTELEMAKSIQNSQLPSLFPPFPDRKEFDIYATMTPAREVGGDFYDFYMVDDRRLCMVIADVAGKGVPASLFMMVSRILIKNRIQGGQTPGQALESVNNQMLEGAETNMFVTVWISVLDLATGRGIAANAGHEHPALRKAGGRYELVRYRHSPAVGIYPEMSFREHEFLLQPGDSLFVYTDGVAEASNAEDELFGPDRMLAALNRDPDAGVKETLENVRNAVNRFVKNAEQFDDLTMLCMKYNGNC